MKAVRVPIHQLRVKSFVRQKLNEEHAIQLAGLYEAGKELPPLKITEDYEVLDGRHRLEAAKLAGMKEISCEFIGKMKKQEMIIYAFAQNVGGALPPTREDINFTIEGLLEKGMGPSAIIKSFDFWPSEVVRKYVKQAQDNISSRRMRAAVKAVSEGNMRVSDAAHQFSIDPEKLKDAIAGKKKNKQDVGVNALKGQITSQFRGHVQMTSKRFERLLIAARDGEIPSSVVDQTFNNTVAAIQRERQLVEQWWNRWEQQQESGKFDPAGEDREDTAEVGGFVL